MLQDQVHNKNDRPLRSPLATPPNDGEISRGSRFESVIVLTSDLRALRTQIQSLRNAGKIFSRRDGMPDFSLVTGAEPTVPILYQEEPTVLITVQGRQHISIASEQLSVASGQYCVMPTGTPLTSHVIEPSHTEPFVGMVIKLNQQLITELIAENDWDWEMRGASSVAVSALDQELADAVFRMLRLLEQPKEQLVLGPLMERELLWRLLLGEQCAIMLQIGRSNHELSRIQRAIRWIHGHYAETVRSQVLAKIACMSISSLNRHFRAATGMSPIEYQKQIRLRQARSRLIQDDADVASVGAEVGYDSPSQFGREYRRLFGISPGKDARRMRFTRIHTDKFRH